MLSACLLMVVLAATPNLPEIQVKGNLTLEKNSQLSARLVLKANYVTIDGNGATLVGPGVPGKPDSFVGCGISAEGCKGITLRNLKVKGFASGLVVSDGEHWLVEDCDFSDNYHAPDAGWGNGPHQGGIILTRVAQSILRNNRANRVWNGLDLSQCPDNLILKNDFSYCSNVCLKMMTACRNHVVDNNLSYGLRMKPGETHARDSTCVLMENGSDANLFRGNDITHGGDGVFIRVLNNWVSTGNVFIENDCSYANNNGFEAWSPGNTYIRNKSNHCSYGFWLGGSDQTVLAGNEAAFNGLRSGRHNAPEPGFGHGGIVFVSGSSSHTRVVGNYCHDNNGGGIVFRGDVASKGKRWRSLHWIIQQNRLENNQWGIYGRFGDWFFLSNNTFLNNAKGNHFDDVANLTEVKGDQSVVQMPRAVLDGPAIARAGQPAVFDAGRSCDLGDRHLTFRWDIAGTISNDRLVQHVFREPGFYRVGLTASNGVLADLAFRDLIVVNEVNNEIGTERQASQWGSEIEGDRTGKAKLIFEDDPGGIIGLAALRFRPNIYPGLNVTAIYPAARNAKWDFSHAKQISFWMKYQNPNPTGFQAAGPVVVLEGPGGRMTYTPASGRNFMRDAVDSEGRWMWQRIVISLKGSDSWTCKTTGNVGLDRIDAISLSFDSWESEPFTIWLDGLTCE